MSDNNNTENINNNTNNDKSNSKEKNECPLKIHFSFMLYSIICIIFLLILICKYSKYTNESKTLIENSIKQFELNSQTQLSNYYEFLKETVTNESFESKEFIKNTLEEAFKPNIDLLRETLKDSKDFSINRVTFWLAFLSLIMIIFTILGIYANNKIMESNQRQSELIINETELKSKEIIENIRKELSKENKEYIENLKVDFNNIKNNVLNEMNIIKTEAINAKDNAINEVNSIKEEINNNKSEAEKLKSEIDKIRDESKELLEEMKKEREAQKQEGKTILNEMEKRQKLNDLLNKAWSESNKDNKEEAIKLYTEALEIDPKNIMALNNRQIICNNKYRESKEENFFNKALETYNNDLQTNKNYYGTYINISFLYLNHYEVNKKENKESLIQAEKYLNEGLKLYPNDLELINNYGILLYSKYMENKTITDLNKSEKYLKKSINKSRVKENIGETYYYLHLVYDEYAKLDNNINGYSKDECKNKSKEYLQKSEDLGYKHFMDK